MKTAKEILDGKIYNRFDLARACEDVARFFEESEASSKLIISGKQFDDIRPDADFYGYFMYQGDEAVNKLVNSRIATEKMGYIGLGFALIETENSCVRKLVDELRKNKLYAERVCAGIYVVTII